MMQMLLLSRIARSFKKELISILAVFFVMLTLPMVAFGASTNVKALVGSDDGGSNDDGNVQLYTDTAQAGDLYDYGNCTYWASLRRIQVGKPIPNTWGNAATWAVRAMLGGWVVDHTPTKYSIMQTPNSAGGLGHVAFVESVDPDGTWHISEMNVVGFDEIDKKAMPASAAARYSFIHDKE